MSEPKLDERIARVLDLIDSATGRPSVNALASAVALSPDRLRHLFREQAGCSIRQYAKRSRMTRALRLVENTRLTIKEVCAQAGLDPSHFAREFKSIHGYGPREWRMRTDGTGGDRDR